MLLPELIPVTLNLGEQRRFDFRSGHHELELPTRTALSLSEIARTEMEVRFVFDDGRGLDEQYATLRSMAVPVIGSLARVRAQLINMHDIAPIDRDMSWGLPNSPDAVYYCLARAAGSLADYTIPVLLGQSPMDSVRTSATREAAISLSHAVEGLASMTNCEADRLHLEHLQDLSRSWPPTEDPYALPIGYGTEGGRHARTAG